MRSAAQNFKNLCRKSQGLYLFENFLYVFESEIKQPSGLSGLGKLQGHNMPLFLNTMALSSKLTSKLAFLTVFSMPRGKIRRGESVRIFAHSSLCVASSGAGPGRPGSRFCQRAVLPESQESQLQPDQSLCAHQSRTRSERLEC